ncbi:GDP-mannose 4,6-dehydratase [Adhaeribacter rhizoryzae]|uniref:NAD-dependent epimerase/dehydratase family protein n=1 Tax=Adhaeribacter rhizoryzae TaxID=2607907 RepID=A0A5M6DQ16_9BACT|nr:GDP-mannose 4,6-dehydratase [Adhaeribacter rhizoryzae]KAA5548319.1 NAD-dependent epimerase/dehydratase family protein [Adhaeribacter rhizoryzae]
MKNLLLTGGAGFIGSNLAEKLLETSKYRITCIDNFDTFYDRSIKENNLSNLIQNPNFKLVEASLLDFPELSQSLDTDFDVIVHLAAKAGVRPSIKDPVAYQTVNYVGTQNLLEFARSRGIKQFVFASSSSVYGINPNMPWSEADQGLKPISPYAASKVACELLGHTYSHLFGIRFIGLRFFTVYGPKQRPDLAIHKFAKMLINEEPITVYGDGSTRRDYTYVDDIVNGVISALDYNKSLYEIINLGNHQTIKLSDLIKELEVAFNKKAKLVYQEEQEGDVPATYADISKAQELLNYNPKTGIKDGLEAFAQWFNQQYKNNLNAG